MKMSSVAAAWFQRFLKHVQARATAQEVAQPQAAQEDTSGEPAVVEFDGGYEVRLDGDVIPHLYAPWYRQGEGVSDVGFIRALDRIPAGKQIIVTINSLGGDVFAGTAIANAVAKRKAHAHVTGIAASIASVILAAGKHSSMGRGATVMVHKPWSYAGGNATAMRAEADVLDKIEDAMVDIYISKSGKKYTRDQWKAALKGKDGADGSWWDGAEAVAAGIADEYEQPEETDDKRRAELIEQRKACAALYCSTLPKHLADTPASVSPESPKVPATVDPEAKPAARTLARVPGVSYLK